MFLHGKMLRVNIHLESHMVLFYSHFYEKAINVFWLTQRLVNNHVPWDIIDERVKELDEWRVIHLMIRK